MTHDATSRLTSVPTPVWSRGDGSRIGGSTHGKPPGYTGWRRLLPVVVALTLLGCEAKAIHGVVVDNFGVPVVGAEVSIKGSAFKTTSSDGGAFELEYAPGQFTVQVAAPEHTRYHQALTVTERVRFPLGEVVLLRLPPADGLRIKTEDGYTLVPSVAYVERKRLVNSMFRAYCVDQKVPRGLPQFSGDRWLAFAPPAPGKGWSLLKPRKGVIASRPTSMMSNCMYSQVQTAKLQASPVSGRVQLEARLEPGVYCLGRISEGMFATSAGKDGACFEWLGQPVSSENGETGQTFPHKGGTGNARASKTSKGANGKTSKGAKTKKTGVNPRDAVVNALDEIRTAEKAYAHEWDTFTATGRTPEQMPQRGRSTAFGQTFGDHSSWDMLGWIPRGPVYGQFEVIVDESSVSREVGFWARAYADTDGDGRTELYEATSKQKAHLVSRDHEVSPAASRGRQTAEGRKSNAKNKSPW